MDKYYDGTIEMESRYKNQKMTNWIISKFILGEYKEFPELVKKYGNLETFCIVTTGKSVYINGILAVEFDDVSSWPFEMPAKWINELYELTTNGEITQFRINNTDIIGHIRTGD